MSLNHRELVLGPHRSLNIIARQQDGSRSWVAPVDIRRICALQNDFPGGAFDVPPMCLKDFENVFIRDRPECFYENPARNAADNSTRSNIGVKSNLTVQPITNMPVVPSGILHIPRKVNDRAHITPQRAGSDQSPPYASFDSGWVDKYIGIDDAFCECPLQILQIN